ncbi:sulfatase [Prolixibacteraceae bacterium]|nr:sulfatase [Prolixibacteraceae bacterium]
MKRTVTLLMFICLSLLGKAQRPNIIFIMSDDHATNAISCYGGRLSDVAPTPNIDRLANEGMRFNNVMCTNAICTPSRAAILSGQYSQVNGVYTLADDYDPEADNVAKQLQKAGYETAIVGKWHLHKEPKGFDYYNVLPGQGRYFDPLFKEKGDKWLDRSKGGKEYPGYVTDVTTDIALDWLKNKRDKNTPFYLMLHQKAPHASFEFATRHKNYLKGVEIPSPKSLWDNEEHGCPKGERYGSSVSQRLKRRNMVDRMSSSWWKTGCIDTTGMSYEEKTNAAYQKYLKDYLRCVKAIDENVGRLLDYLDTSGLVSNTIVVYTSDQGQFLGEHDYTDKRWMYEESLHMPFLVRYPKVVKKGSVNNDICLNIDFAPTFLDFAGVNQPDQMQGNSFRQILNGKTPKDWRRSMYYRYWMHMAHHDNPAHYGVRTDRYKLIFFYGLPLEKRGAVSKPTEPYWELYDLKKDPLEMNNIYGHKRYRKVVYKLKKELLQLKQKYKELDEDLSEMVDVTTNNW